MSDSVRPHRQKPTRLPRPWNSPGKNTGVGCHFLPQCMKVKSEKEVAQSCLTLGDPMDYSLPGSSIHGIFQARVLEWGAIAFSVCSHTYIQTNLKILRAMLDSPPFATAPPQQTQVMNKLFQENQWSRWVWLSCWNFCAEFSQTSRTHIPYFWF